jgi:3-methyladenine DNA glycosylase/8-oxoguanine DNA glycosylase
MERLIYIKIPRESDNPMRIKMKACLPFSLYSTVRSHGWYQLAPFSFEPEPPVLRYILRLESGRVVELKISELADGVHIETKGDVAPEEKQEMKQRVSWMLGLDRDFSSFYRLARKEPKLVQMEKKAQGRTLRSATLFEDVIKTILTTNTLWAATKRMNANLIEQFGDPLGENPSQKAFPTPVRLAKTSEDILRKETRLGYRAPYVLKLAESITEGKIDLESFKNPDVPTEQLRKKLLEIKGVGDYAAANLLNILGRYDFLPVDSWALKVVSYEWYNGASIGKKEVETAFEHWGNWKGLAYWFWDWSYYRKNEKKSDVGM